MIRSFIAFSPEVSPFNNYLVPERIELCIKEDPEYKPCTSNVRSPDFLHNAETNLRRIQKRIAVLKATKSPVGLEAVVSYVLAVQEFGYWKEKQRLEYLKSGNVAALKARFREIDPSRQCSPELAAVERAPDIGTGLKIAWHDWGNCVLRSESRNLGRYPNKNWEQFLNENGISEKLVQDNGPNE